MIQGAEARKVTTQFADQIDFSRVDHNDRDIMRQIILGIVQFEHPMPKLDIDIHPLEEKYNITIKGWAKMIDDTEWYNRFLNPHTRGKVNDAILFTGTNPNPDNRGEPIKLVSVRRTTFNASTSMKKRATK